MLGLFMVIFVADTITDMEIAVAVFYVAVVLIAAGFLRTRGVLAVSAICVVLTIASLMFTRSGAYEAGVINCALSLCAIVITTYLALTKSSAILAEHEARAQLVRLARVNSLGELTASIAHEVNQPLTGVITSGNAGLRWLAAAPPNLPKAQQALKRIISDANRASSVVGRVRSLSKRAEPKAEWLNAVMIVNEIVALSRGELDQHNIVVRTHGDDDLPLVFADGVQIQQVMLNIILNAAEAMANTPEDQREIVIVVSRQDGRCVQFSIADNGCGISPDTVEGVFEAFQTTKPDGMGIGLAVSRSIVEAHGGRIWASPRRGGGAEFHFTLRGQS
ncbi:ATPase [Pannonibacter phragmitetus]|jgi:signal transduction histidine kinase|uniref:histidine kinase n=2 Tax=Pannonibacter phragmitetus TaxID=121719 RepID=A0A0U2W7X0_9HYPH|nr:ATPase [Pannonibacter phragmitetus]